MTLVPTLKNSAAAVAALLSISALPTPALAYPVDCAILLCLAGGWPASAECSHARAVFIRRITPWPVEPPLQIWRCPMGAAFKSDSVGSAKHRLYEALSRAHQSGPQSNAHDDTATITPLVFKVEDAQFAFDNLLTKITAGADIDISDPAFNFVRSIRVYHMQFRQQKGRDECTVQDASRIGLYGQQGDYSWQGHNLRGVTYDRVWVENGRDSGWRDVPQYSWNAPSQSSIQSIPHGDCNPISIRAVGVSWTDWEGQPGFEEVHY